MGFLVGMKSILVICIIKFACITVRQLDQTIIFVVCSVVGFEVDEVDFPIMRIVSVLLKL